MSLFKKALHPQPPDPETAPQALPAAQQAPTGPEPLLWAVIESARFPGDDVLVVLDPTRLKEAQAAHPGLVTYLSSEIELLWPVREKDELVRAVHKVKKHLGGWLREIKPRLSTV